MNEVTKEKVLEALGTKAMTKLQLSKKLSYSVGYLGKILCSLRKEHKCGLYYNKYWGVK